MAKDLTEALRLLSESAGSSSRRDTKLPDAREQPAIPPRSGMSGPVARKQGGGGIASPLTETAYADRTFHAETAITSTDGLFVLKIKPVKKVIFTDADGATAEIEFKAPT